MKKFLFFAAVLAFAALTSVAQSTTTPTTTTTSTSKTSSKQLEPFRPRVIVGVNNTFEFASEINKPLTEGAITSIKYFNVAPFLSIEAQLSRHSGLELDLGYRYVTYQHNVSFNGFETPIVPDTYVHYFTVGVMYKFYSRILNFTAGVSADISCTNKPEHYYDSTDPRFGLVLRLTKDIRIYKGLMIEPYLQFNPLYSSARSYITYGAGVGIKYAFTCGRNK